MSTTKTKLSISILTPLADILEKFSKENKQSKSSIIEFALQKLYEKQLISDAKKLAEIKFNDLPTEDEWIAIQSDPK